jgi:hypothetical protein
MAQGIGIASPFAPAQLILLVSPPDVVGPEIEVRFFRIVVKADMAIDSASQVAVFVEFNPVALDFHLGLAKRSLSRQGFFLGEGVPAGYQAEDDHEEVHSGFHCFTVYRTKTFPLVEGPLLP